MEQNPFHSILQKYTRGKDGISTILLYVGEVRRLHCHWEMMVQICASYSHVAGVSVIQYSARFIFDLLTSGSAVYFSSYYGAFAIGTPARVFLMQIDTGALVERTSATQGAYVWRVPTGSTKFVISGLGSSAYLPDSSSTSLNTGRPFQAL